MANTQADGFLKRKFLVKLFLYQCNNVVESALKAYTVDAAYASFEEGIKGKLKAGYLADLAFLGEDILGLPEERHHELWNVKVKATMVGGNFVHWEM